MNLTPLDASRQPSSGSPAHPSFDQVRAARLAEYDRLAGLPLPVEQGCEAPLGPRAKNASPPELPDGYSSKPESKLAYRYKVQDGARLLAPRERVARCMRFPHGRGEGNTNEEGSSLVHVMHDASTGRASYAGLVTCGSVWMCPVCAAKISEKRRQELADAISRHEANGGRVVMVTFTIKHHSGDDLESMVQSIKQARKRMLSGKRSASFNARYGVVGRVRAFEVTHGFRNGWHPHIHELVFLDGPVDLAAFQTELRRAWASSVEKAGLREVNDYGCKVSFADSAEGVLTLGEYVAKMGELGVDCDNRTWGPECELSKQTVKRGKAGRNPFELLEAFTFGGDFQAGALWQEYARVFKGERLLRWSNGLRDLLGMGAEESDEALAEEVEATGTGSLLVSLTVQEWRSVVGQDLRAELLEEARSGSCVAVTAFLMRNHIWKPSGFS